MVDSGCIGFDWAPDWKVNAKVGAIYIIYIYIGLHLQKRSGGCLHSILSHHNNFKIMYIIWIWLIYCTKIMKNRSSILHIFVATYHLTLTSHDWRNPCWRLRFWPAWTLVSGMRQDSQDSNHDTKTIASTYYILHIFAWLQIMWYYMINIDKYCILYITHYTWRLTLHRLLTHNSH